MLLGQLYAYASEIKNIPSEIKPEQVNNLQILGLQKQDLAKISELSGDALKFELKAKFSQNYEQVLLENNLLLAAKIWQFITSPSLQTIFPNTSKEYLGIIKNWSDQDFSNSNWHEILGQGLLTTDQNSFAIYYGLALLHKLSVGAKHNNLVYPDLKLPEFEKSKDIKPITLGIMCQPLYSSLFVNLGALFIPEQDENTLLKAISIVIEENSDLSTLLLVGQSAEVEKIIKKEFPSLILINLEWNIWETSEKGFFDELAMSSLGVRL